MSAYYNEIDPYAAQWLRNLIAAGHIADGDVDERSIVDVRPTDLSGFTQCHFFAGIGGWSLALRLAEWPDDREVWTGSCPCQPFSQAGSRAGSRDARHLWPAFYNIISECRPPTVFGEQVASVDGRSWFSAVRFDLEALGYAVGGADLCAAGVGAPHIRQRLWWVADSDTHSAGWPNSGGGARPESESSLGVIAPESVLAPWNQDRPPPPGDSWLDHGLPTRVGAVRAYGNAIVPQVAAKFIKAALT